MSKTQKIWLSIFLGMFIVPEVIWGSTFGYLSLTNRLFQESNKSLLLLVLLVQIVGCAGAIIYLIKNQIRKNILFWVIVAILILVLFKSLFLFYVIFATKNISFP